MTQAQASDLGDDSPLYASAPKIYPQKVTGTYRRIKWILLAVTLGIYYFLPFVRWDRGPDAPNQAVLIDFANRKFYFFFIEIWPQEIYYLTGLLILAAMTLFLMNALAGRVWCGYLCPQTVWTDLFFWTERLFEGDRRERMRKDAGPWTFQRVREKTLKHVVWLAVAWWTGGAWVLYFADAPTLVGKMARFEAPPTALIWIAILTTTTYVLAGFMREQVCLYMCPWPRIQAALTDENALNVTYRYDRGEPRESLKKAKLLRSGGEKIGDCIDCGQCVAVCPTGVDIRQGPSLGCIQCGLCIDACDTVMAKIDRPPRLIAYDTDLNVARRLAGKPNAFKLIRGRTILYAVVISAVGGIMIAALVGRKDVSLSVMHDRNPMFVKTSDGSIRNAVTAHIVNRHSTARSFSIEVERPAGARVAVVGGDNAEAAPIIEVGPDQVREVRVFVIMPRNDALPASQELVLKLKDAASGASTTATDNFFAP
ncbi:cytochrome c oxidase accessory protein CcoG [Methylocella silvestris]|uniref:Cytochrome c oxidase accessory protein CcoG n=1 Tax=Methylocella silvestris TaxID=199596 RepID=A0A2J7TLR6_METSI|nr:cytochrome c oxidase accessory protein CcoG [Methylocella silvestris]PNG27715.1 cytochrome c oxidase accessory protein CcoG [Methylocella silvestris]